MPLSWKISFRIFGDMCQLLNWNFDMTDFKNPILISDPLFQGLVGQYRPTDYRLSTPSVNLPGFPSVSFRGRGETSYNLLPVIIQFSVSSS